MNSCKWIVRNCLLAGLCLVACILFLNAGGLAAKLTEIVKLGTPHLAAADDVDVVDDRRVQREDAFDAHAEAHLADRNGLADAAVLAGYDDPLKNLQALLVAFLDADVHFDSVARLKSRNVLSYLCVLNQI